MGRLVAFKRQQLLRLLSHGGLVVFQAKVVGPPFLHDQSCSFIQAVHGVGGYRHMIEVREPLNQSAHHRDLVAFFLHGFLCQKACIGMVDGAHQMQGIRLGVRL